MWVPHQIFLQLHLPRICIFSPGSIQERVLILIAFQIPRIEGWMQPRILYTQVSEHRLTGSISPPWYLVFFLMDEYQAAKVMNLEDREGDCRSELGMRERAISLWRKRIVFNLWKTALFDLQIIVAHVFGLFIVKVFSN